MCYFGLPVCWKYPWTFCTSEKQRDSMLKGRWSIRNHIAQEALQSGGGSRYVQSQAVTKGWGVGTWRVTGTGLVLTSLCITWSSTPVPLLPFFLPGGSSLLCSSVCRCRITSITQALLKSRSSCCNTHDNGRRLRNPRGTHPKEKKSQVKKNSVILMLSPSDRYKDNSLKTVMK